ncbi:DNA primase catalytic subunit PriS [Candidatus Micrarchaeota archaeon]|nr:DNA primase catalytic subunit PriS [Candidatus Micrarchaeota archaeon]
MNEKELKFLQAHFRSHYQKHLPVPPDLASREFGFGWQKKIDYRHQSFASHKEFQDFMLTEVPLYVSYSLAYYQFPDKRPVSAKGFQGADLVFDLDQTNAEHDHSAFFCRGCLECLHREALGLKDMLSKDLGFESTLVFSGQKGFHLHVRSEKVRDLGKEARKQIADYVSAEGLDMRKLLPVAGESIELKFREGIRNVPKGPQAQSRGCTKRAYEAMRKAIESEDEKALKAYGLGRKNISYIKQNKQRALENLEKGNWGAFCDSENLDRVFANVVKTVRFVQTDKAVTFDLSRIIRLPDSLHGSTGFTAKTLKEGEKFKVEDAMAFKGEEIIEVIPREDVDFTLNGEWRLRKAKFEGLPMPIALFAIAQEKALLP